MLEHRHDLAVNERGGEPLGDLATRKLRWGVIKLPSHLEDQLVNREENDVMHLGFGSKKDYISMPIDGHRYI